MSAEVPLQFDLFSGELVDLRSESQKRRDRERNVPRQMQMFATPEMVQFGNSTHTAYRDWLDQAAAPILALEIQDVRTPEEIERDHQRTAEALTLNLFVLDEKSNSENTASVTQEHATTREYPPLIVGYRVRQRYFQTNVRRRVAKTPAG